MSEVFLLTPTLAAFTKSTGKSSAEQQQAHTCNPPKTKHFPADNGELPQAWSLLVWLCSVIAAPFNNWKGVFVGIVGVLLFPSLGMEDKRKLVQAVSTGSQYWSHPCPALWILPNL